MWKNITITILVILCLALVLVSYKQYERAERQSKLAEALRENSMREAEIAQGVVAQLRSALEDCREK